MEPHGTYPVAQITICRLQNHNTDAHYGRLQTVGELLPQMASLTKTLSLLPLNVANWNQPSFPLKLARFPSYYDPYPICCLSIQILQSLTQLIWVIKGISPHFFFSRKSDWIQPVLPPILWQDFTTCVFLCCYHCLPMV